MNIELRLRDGGGDLMTRVSPDEAGPGNYVEKRDWRRDFDQEARREGDILFEPKANTFAVSPFPQGAGTSPLTLIFTARKDNGKTALIVGTATTLYRYFAYEDQEIVAVGVLATGIAGTISDGTWLVIGSGFTTTNAHRWEAVNVGGKIVFNNGVDLPVSYDLHEFAVKPLYELREQGIAFVGTIQESNGVLICGDLAEIHDYQVTTVLELIGYATFGAGQEDNYNRVHYNTVWSDPAGVDRWGATVPGTITAGTRTLTLDADMLSLNPGDEVRIVGAGENDGDLITTLGYKSGTGVWILIDAAVTSVVLAAVGKSDAASLIAGAYSLLDDSSPILRIVKHQDRTVVCKGTGFILAEFTGDRANPFQFLRVYTGEDAVFWRWTVIDVRGEFLLYAGRSEFYTFDLVSRQPRQQAKLRLCSNLFFDEADASRIDEVYAADNAATKEIWFSIPWGTVDKMLAYDYRWNTCATLGALYAAAAMVEKPKAGVSHGTAETWFVMSTAVGTLVQNSLTMWNRRGVSYNSDLTAGLADFGDAVNEKHVGQYLVILGSLSDANTVTVALYGTRNPGEAVTELPGSPIEFATPLAQNTAYLHHLVYLIQERLRVSGGGKCKISKRVWGVSRAGGASIQRR